MGKDKLNLCIIISTNILKKMIWLIITYLNMVEIREFNRLE